MPQNQLHNQLTTPCEMTNPTDTKNHFISAIDPMVAQQYIAKAIKEGKVLGMDQKLIDLITKADDLTSNIILVYYSIK